MTSPIGFLPKKNRSQGAFTLIEILLVVLVLAVIVGISIPNFQNTYQKFSLKKNVDDVLYTMRYAQSRAVMKNLIVRLEFNEDFSQYWLTQEEPSEESTDKITFEDVDGSMGRIFNFDHEVKVESSGNAIQFYPDGNIDKLELKMCSEGGCFKVITNQQRGYVNAYPVESDEK